MFLIRDALLVVLVNLPGLLSAPTRQRLEDIQCRCLSLSTAGEPTLCSYLEPHVLDWQTAYSIATGTNLKIEFTSEITVTKMLSVPKPLPSNVLHSLTQEAEAPEWDPSETVRYENKIVCGLSDALDHSDDRQDEVPQPELHYIGTVLAIFMLLLIVTVTIEYYWQRWNGQEGSIKLEGNEKTLTAGITVYAINAPLDYAIWSAPANYS